MRLEQAASAREVRSAAGEAGVEERATRHLELRGSVDARAKAADKEALAQVADALECAAVALSAGAHLLRLLIDG
jgi:hypothetical protein